MAISDSVQTLTAAFSFGILLQAATATLFIYSKDHRPAIFKDGRRLVLVLFLLFAALWAQIDFINLLITAKHSTLCQATLTFSTAFDQFARFTIEQYLVWSLAQGTKANAGQMILQAILGLRLISGGILVGFTRPDFAPVCIARTSVEPVGIVVLSLDFVLLGMVLVRSVSSGMFRDLKDSRSSTRDQSKGLMMIIVGFTVWTVTSVPMMLGTSTIILIARTVVPANGLLILVGILTFSSESLLEVRQEITTPEAHSPFVSQPSLRVQTRDIFRENIGDGSPIASNSYTKGGSLFVVNPSSNPAYSPKAPQGYIQSNSQVSSKLGEEITGRDLGAGESASRNVPGYRGSSGVFPTFLTSSMSYDQGALAPHIRPNVIDSTRNVPLPVFPSPTVQRKRSLFHRSKQSTRPHVKALGISKPVMNEEGPSSQQPFARILTIDLAQAAVNERERREAAAERSRLVADRPAPQPPQRFSFPAQEGLRKSISVKRKEMPRRPQAPLPTVASSASSGLSVDAANGSTTSASLSPGRDEVRRRSPRSTNTFGGSIDDKARPLPPPQMKQTVGLPSNPRLTRIGPAPPAGKEQTVMFMNNIIYDNPGIVKTIIKDAPEMYASAKRAKESEKSPTALCTTDQNSSGSIIHRPRPYRRLSEAERALFLSEPSPRHRRSKSGSSITTRKSILTSHPGSPSQLPPLPAPPTSASKLKRLLPNDTKSMTFDEKIQLLFPAPPGVSALHNRRSSVPSLPRLPSVFISETLATQTPTQEEHASQRASKRATIASFAKSEALLQASKEDFSKGQERQTYRFSANTYRTLADQVGETWMPGIPFKEANFGSLALNLTDMDSHITQNMRKSVMTETSSSNMSTDDDSTQYWGSVHSEISPVDVSKVMTNANTTFIKRSRAGTLEELTGATPSPQADDAQYGEVIMTVMLDCEEGSKSNLPSANDNRQSFYLDADQSLPGDKTPTTSWHRRIGDELPTFSERKAKTRSRKMPPPTPLLLNQRGRGATVVVRAPESSPTMDSPEKAIAEIQAQLVRFEEFGRGSVGSLLRHIPDATSRGDAIIEDHSDRFRLLENLENEMGQQENQWQQMQTNLDRDSISSIMTPQTLAPSVSEISRESSQRSSRPQSRVISRRARIRSSTTIRSKGNESNLSTSTQSSNNFTASIWQQRLADAQMEYMENAPALLRKRSLNFLSVSKSHQLGSPTPPDSVGSGTDMETDSEVESESEYASVSVPKEPASLWQARLPSPKAAVGRMWNPPYETTDGAASPELPGKNVRPTQRRIQAALHISSFGLWVKPNPSVKNRLVFGLWFSRLKRPVSIRTRPVTQRPPRKNKRVTFLPDIIENPVPLPNKRNTLGIFQFPWGETSDNAVYQPAFNPALLYRPILNAKLDVRSRQLEPENPESEYSSSFFDDYDDDMDEDSEDDTESEDDFDETTLWEIASLLKSEDVPSKNSLFLGRRDIVENYNDEADFEGSESERVEMRVATRPETKLPILPLAMATKKQPTVESRTDSKLWASDTASTLAALSAGLPQPEEQVWEAYVPGSQDVVRLKPRFSETSPFVTSHDLWEEPRSEGKALVTSTMGSGIPLPEINPSVIPVPKAGLKLMLTPQPEEVEISATDLFPLNAKSSEFHTIQASSAVSSMFQPPQNLNATLPSPTSKNSCTTEPITANATAWISQSTAPKLKAPAQIMWKPAASVPVAAITGLFSPSYSCPSYQTTTISAADLITIHKPRSRVSRSPAPLSPLSSTHLWTPSSSLASLQTEHHWISESSTRPASPSICSENSSGRSSPVSETSSLSGLSLNSALSTSTKASSLWGSIKSASRPAWWDTKGLRDRETSSPSSVVESTGNAGSGKSENGTFASKLPIPGTKGRAQQAPVRESRVLAISDMWEARAPVSFGETPKRNFRCITTIKKQETQAVDAVKQPLRRQIAMKADWDAALQEAITKGTPAKPLRYDPALRHPVFFTELLVSTIAEVHPASIGHVRRMRATPEMWAAALEEAISQGAIITPTKAQQYDSAVLHPVFFTANLSSSITNTHPATIGHVARHQALSLWTPPRPHAIVLEAPIGAMWKKGKLAAAQFEHEKNPRSRRAPTSRSIKLPPLDSTSIWQPTQAQAIEKGNMVVPAKLARGPTWAAHVMVRKENSNSLWVPDPVTYMTSSTVQKSSPSPIASTQAFSSPIRASAVIIPQTPASVARSQTWKSAVATSTAEVRSSTMWEYRPSPWIKVAEKALFSDPHTEPWSRRNRSHSGEDLEVEDLESQELWSRKWMMPESPKRWLEGTAKKINKVQFRY